jgi:hypothetical protein
VEFRPDNVTNSQKKLHVTRIFLTLASVSTLLLFIVIGLGLNIGDPKLPAAQPLVSWHMILALAGLVFAALVHALVLTYFMGTGRWMEDVSKAYQLDEHWRAECQRLKYRALPLMTLSLLLLLVTIGFGAAADPASRLGFSGWGGLPASQWHLIIALITVAFNFYANTREFQAIERNGQLVSEVVAKVRELRIARGLPV